MRDFIVKYQYGLFATLGAVVVLWQVLLPGYVLLLDWIGGPHSIVAYHSLANIVSAPSNGLLYLLELFIPAWVVQKFIFFGMFFILFYFPLRFYPFERKCKINEGESQKSRIEMWKYFASLLFVFNPFVYERVLAGQWRVVLGYAFMFPLVYYLFRFTSKGTVSNKQSWRAVVGIIITLLITGMWSVHFLAVGVVIICLYVLIFTCVYLMEKQFDLLWAVSKKFIIGAVIFGILSCYWIIPYKLQGQKTLEEFGVDHWQAFATASDEYVGVVGNVITLRGFWGESHIWENQFKMPWNNPIIFYGVFIVIVLLSIIGLYAMWRGKLESRYALIKARNISVKSQRIDVIFISGLFVLSIIFATGVSAFGLWMINEWLFENVGFWSGFRDSQKWSGVTALVYVLLSSVGIRVLVGKFKSQKIKKIIVSGLLLVIPVLFVPQMLFGFNGQIKSVWYPESWQRVNQSIKGLFPIPNFRSNLPVLPSTCRKKFINTPYLCTFFNGVLNKTEQFASKMGIGNSPIKSKVYKAESDKCKALFLPWHQYYTVDFNDDMLVANPSHRFFNCEIVAGHNTELGNIKSVAGGVDDYYKIEKFIMSNNPQREFVNRGIKLLRQNNIQYIIWTNDLVNSDLYKYPFLQSEELEKIIDEEEIVLYEIKN